MKDNPLMKYSEQLAIEIEKLCKSLDKKITQIPFFKFANLLQVYLLIFLKRNILKVLPICYLSLRLHARNVSKQKAGLN